MRKEHDSEKVNPRSLQLREVDLSNLGVRGPLKVALMTL